MNSFASFFCSRDNLHNVTWEKFLTFDDDKSLACWFYFYMYSIVFVCKVKDELVNISNKLVFLKLIMMTFLYAVHTKACCHILLCHQWSELSSSSDSTCTNNNFNDESVSCYQHNILTKFTRFLLVASLDTPASKADNV